MEIYGIYENNKREQCITVGTLIEIKRFLNVGVRSLNNILRTGEYGKIYKIKYLYTEK